LRERRKVLNILREIAALIFDRLLRFERRALLFIEAIDLFADPSCARLYVRWTNLTPSTKIYFGN
jgi:hypothetical protein